MRFLPRLRVDDEWSGIVLPFAWTCVAGLLVVLAPVQLWIGRAVWNLEPREIPQALMGGMAFLTLALFLRIASARPSGIGTLATVAASLVCFGSAFVLLWLLRSVPYSRGMMSFAAIVGTLLALLPFHLRRSRRWAFVAMTAALAATVLLDFRRRESDTEVIREALHQVEVRSFRNLVARPLVVDGGAIMAYGRGFLLVTGPGDVYRLSWNARGDSLRSEQLSQKVPLDRATFVAERLELPNAQRLRVTGMLLDTVTSPPRVIVAHQHWNHDQRCFTIRVSAAAIEPTPVHGDRPDGIWETLFDSRPCLKPTGAFRDIETGGRLAWGPTGELLLSTGDHGYSGLASEAFAQRTDNDYGKVLEISRDGRHRIFSLGHRNPQGLTVDRAGRVWETEHGPRGGDEINLLIRGANYGWPFATYGTEYGLDVWPLAPDARDHGRFTEPAQGRHRGPCPPSV